MDRIQLNVDLLRRRVLQLTKAARSVGLRPATVSNLTTGKTSIARTEVRTLVALANLDDCSLDELIIQGERYKMIETGIKTIDLFAPLAKGGTAGLVARPGMGQLVVLAEIFYRLKKDGSSVVVLKPEASTQESMILQKILSTSLKKWKMLRGSTGSRERRGCGICSRSFSRAERKHSTSSREVVLH